MGETTIIIDHTGVPDALWGAVLVRRGVEDARAKGRSTFGADRHCRFVVRKSAVQPE